MSNSLIFLEARDVLKQLLNAINQLSHDEYRKKIALLSDGTIGQHTRHIIELFQQLLIGYDSGIVNYDNRKRNIYVQENIDFASKCIDEITNNIIRANKELKLITVYNSEEIAMNTNYLRELLYNIEHCIHHEAIIKISLMHLGKTGLKNDFGVAKSTLNYKK